MKATDIRDRCELGKAYGAIKIIFDIRCQVLKLPSGQQRPTVKLVGVECIVAPEQMDGQGCRNRMDDKDLRWGAAASPSHREA
jgi:hypothetical protein